MIRFAIPLVLLVFVGCAGPPAIDAPLKVTRDVSFSVDGGVHRTGLPALPAGSGSTESTATEAPPTFEGRVRLVRLDPTTAEAVLGVPCFGAEAKVAAAADVDRVLAELEAGSHVTLAADTRLFLARGQRGAMRVSNEFAYVASFDLDAVAGAAILDPVVETETVGMQVALRADYDDESGPWDVAVELDVADVNRPVPHVAIHPPGGMMTTVEIETPVFGRVGLDSYARLEVGDAFVIFVPSPDGAAILMVSVTPARAAGAQPADPASERDLGLSAKPGFDDLPILERVPGLADRFARPPAR